MHYIFDMQRRMRDLLTRLQWRHLRLIHAIDEYGQLSVAADRLATTQPGASRMLAEVEAMVGQPIFTRNPKGMTPTPIGEVLIRHAAELLQGLSATVSEVSAFGAGKTGSVRVGSVTGAAVAYLVPAIQTLKENAEGAEINVGVGPSGDLVQGLLNGEYDFVLCRVPPEHDTRQFDILRGRVETTEFLVRKGHPLLEVATPSLQDLSGYSWVIQGPGAPMREAIEEAFLSNNILIPQEIVNTTSLLVMIAYLQTSDAISPVSSEVAGLLQTSQVGGMATVKPRQSIIISPYHVITKRGQMISPLAQNLLELVAGALEEF